MFAAGPGLSSAVVVSPAPLSSAVVSSAVVSSALLSAAAAVPRVRLGAWRQRDWTTTLWMLLAHLLSRWRQGGFWRAAAEIARFKVLLCAEQGRAGQGRAVQGGAGPVGGGGGGWIWREKGRAEGWGGVGDGEVAQPEQEDSMRVRIEEASNHVKPDYYCATRLSAQASSRN